MTMASSSPSTRKEDSPTQTSSTERIWGKKVLAHGYAGIPSILIRGQRRLGLNAMQMNILVQLLEYMFDPNRPPFPSKRDLADRLGVSPKTIQTNMAALEKAGFVRREQVKTRFGDYGSNKYHLDGLVEKVKKLEPDFAAERNARQAAKTKTETPLGKRAARTTPLQK